MMENMRCHLPEKIGKYRVLKFKDIKENIVSQLKSKFNVDASKDEIYVVLNAKYAPPFCISFYNNQLVGITAIRNTIEIEVQRG